MGRKGLSLGTSEGHNCDGGNCEKYMINATRGEKKLGPKSTLKMFTEEQVISGTWQ
jgi:hypothetical protein